MFLHWFTIMENLMKMEIKNKIKSTGKLKNLNIIEQANIYNFLQLFGGDI